jgi:hypothetical protein
MRNEKIMRLVREPLLHFLLIGVGLFWLYNQIQPAVDDDSTRVVVTSSQVEQITAQFSRTWLRPPSEMEISGLIESYVRDEVYYREALVLGLDQNDAQVRQRMRQKLEFILEDLTASEANDETLSLFLQQHPDKFSLQTQTSFQQIYLNPDKRQDLQADAAIMLQSLRAGAVPETLADPTMLPYAHELLTPSEIARQLGDLFAQEVDTLSPGDWAGPIYSGLGVHLVKVTERVPGRLPELAEVRAEVEREYLAQRRQQQKDRAYQKMLEAYEVIIETASSGKPEDEIVAVAQTRGAGE